MFKILGSLTFDFLKFSKVFTLVLYNDICLTQY